MQNLTLSPCQTAILLRKGSVACLLDLESQVAHMLKDAKFRQSPGTESALQRYVTLFSSLSRNMFAEGC